jgi:hypothetical protein
MDRSMCRNWGKPVTGLYKYSEQGAGLYNSFCVVLLDLLKNTRVLTSFYKQFSSIKTYLSYLKNTDLYPSSTPPTTATIYLNTFIVERIINA